MKKVVAFIITVAMLFSLSVVAFAEPGAFVESPSKKRTPTLIEVVPGSMGDCTGRIVITGYAERNKLPEADRTVIEAAYAQIKATEDVTTLNGKLAELANKARTQKTTSLAVSELFNIHLEGCTNHDDHYDPVIVIEPESLVGFVALMYFENGVWHIVEDAQVINDDQHLKFTVKAFGPYAIVVNTEELETPNPTGDNLTYILIAVAIISAAGLVIVGIKSKRNRA